MKKIIGGVALLTLLTTAAQAQIAPGTSLLGGTLSYSTQSREGTLYQTEQNRKMSMGQRFTVGPTAGYFLSENLAVGFALNYSIDKNTAYQYVVVVPVSSTGPSQVVEGGTIEVKTRNVSVGPMARYYAFVGEKAAFFGQLGAGYQSMRTELTPVNVLVGAPNESRNVGSGYYAQLTPGFAFFPTTKFGLEVSLQGLMYQHANYETTYFTQQSTQSSESTSSRFDIGIGLSNLQVGAAFYLGR